MTSENPQSTPAPAAAFVTTQWTRVLLARGDSPEAKAALSDLCAAYYEPVFAFIRRNTSDPEAAKDLTQEFFTRLLARQGLHTVAPERGRFRSFLLGAVKHFISDARDRTHALKRGGGQQIEPIDAQSDPTTELQLTDPQAPSPDRDFDRKWALILLDRALAQLAREHKDQQKAGSFEALKPWLTGDTENLSQAEIATRLGLNEGAVKVAVHRLRRRFREVIKAEIRQTLTDPAQVDEEMHYLLEALTQ